MSPFFCHTFLSQNIPSHKILVLPHEDITKCHSVSKSQTFKVTIFFTHTRPTSLILHIIKVSFMDFPAVHFSITWFLPQFCRREISVPDCFSLVLRPSLTARLPSQLNINSIYRTFQKWSSLSRLIEIRGSKQPRFMLKSLVGCTSFM